MFMDGARWIASLPKICYSGINIHVCQAIMSLLSPANNCTGTHSITNAVNISPTNGGFTGLGSTVSCKVGYTLHPGNEAMICIGNSWQNIPVCLGKVQSTFQYTLIARMELLEVLGHHRILMKTTRHRTSWPVNLTLTLVTLTFDSKSHDLVSR